MTKRRLSVILAAALVSLVLVTAVFAASIDPVTRTVTSTNLYVAWDKSNPEMIVDLRWKGSANLTNTAIVGGCPDPLEFFGDSWVTTLNSGTPDPNFHSLVGWGTTGTWDGVGASTVRISGQSRGCPGSADVPVQTNYRFFDEGLRANTLQVQRRFLFGSEGFEHALRPYIPRLYPFDKYYQVLHPNASGTALLVDDSLACPFGCEVTDWDATWFAIHDPVSGRGLIVKRHPMGYSATLWVDQDAASATTASSVWLHPPAGGFRNVVTEQEFLCFYDSTIWAPSLSLPPGC